LRMNVTFFKHQTEAKSCVDNAPGRNRAVPPIRR
jgi:hypothetical protein